MYSEVVVSLDILWLVLCSGSALLSRLRRACLLLELSKTVMCVCACVCARPCVRVRGDMFCRVVLILPSLIQHRRVVGLVASFLKDNIIFLPVIGSIFF
jgi:hypothetical protein